MQEQLSVRIDSELRAWLVRRAAAEVRTVGALVRSILVGAMWADSPRPLPEEAIAAIKQIQAIPAEWGGRPAEVPRSVPATDRGGIEAIHAIERQAIEQQAEAESEVEWPPTAAGDPAGEENTPAVSDRWADLDIPEPLRRTPQT
jgi:plasmid stability protein